MDALLPPEHSLSFGPPGYPGQPVCSDMWVREVYRHFREAWSLTGRMWSSVGELRFGPRRPEIPEEHHAAVVFIRLFFPDHVARAELIDHPGKGMVHTCVRCRRQVLYDRRFDAYVTRLDSPHSDTHRTTETRCADGRAHIILQSQEQD